MAHWDILKDTCSAKHGLESAAERLRIDMAYAEALQHALQHGLPDNVPNGTHAFTAVQQAIACTASAQVLAVTPLPGNVTLQLLQTCGYSGDQIEAIEMQRVRGFADLPCSFEECSAGGTHTETHVIMDTLDDLRLMKSRLLGQHKRSTEAVQAQLAQQLAHPDVEDAYSDEQKSTASASEANAQVSPAFKLHLCDWGRVSPAMKAQVALDGSFHSMTSYELASLLGVGAERQVLDHVAWSA